MLAFDAHCRELTLRCLQGRLCRLDLRLRSEIFSLGIVDFLLSDHPGLCLGDPG